jgi:ribosomal protein L12E/L44/L45/RPP1/RPP2
VDLETAAKVNEWRQKVLSNALSDDELRAWIKLVREDRVGAAATSARSRAKKAPVDTGELLDEIDKL